MGQSVGVAVGVPPVGVALDVGVLMPCVGLEVGVLAPGVALAVGVCVLAPGVLVGVLVVATTVGVLVAAPAVLVGVFVAQGGLLAYCSTRVCAAPPVFLKLPDAHSAPPREVTASRRLSAVPGSSLGDCVQAVPSQWRASVTGP